MKTLKERWYLAIDAKSRVWSRTFIVSEAQNIMTMYREMKSFVGHLPSSVPVSGFSALREMDALEPVSLAYLFRSVLNMFDSNGAL